MKLTNHLAFAGVAGLLAASTCAAGVVYEASYSGTDKLPYYLPVTPGGNPVGDEIELAGTARVLTEFHFAYYSDYSAPGALAFALYANDGPPLDGNATPGTLLFADIYDVVEGTSGVDVDIPFTPDFGDPLPDTLTWVVSFTGQGTAGLLLADAATTGFSYDDFWEYVDGAWAPCRAVGGYYSNFEARVTAIPETNPGVAATLAMAGLGIFAAYRRSQRK